MYIIQRAVASSNLKKTMVFGQKFEKKKGGRVGNIGGSSFIV